MNSFRLSLVILGFALALSFAARAQFSTSEYGTGAFETGSANSFVHGLASYENVPSADLSSTINQLKADCSANIFPEAIFFMDASMKKIASGKILAEQSAFSWLIVELRSAEGTFS